MKVPAYVRRAIAGWLAWRFEQQRPLRQHRLYSAVPELRELDRRQAALARQHRPGGRALVQEKRRVMTARLRLEVTHG